MTTLVFAHGWGSGPFVWQKILSEFSDYDVHVIDMGFLGKEDLTMPDGPFIGIGHSLGGMWLLKNYPDQMTGFVSIASFNCFHKHTAQHILSKMQKNVIKDTAAQLKDFWHYAGMKQPKDIMNLKPLKLLEGLKSLSKWQADIPDKLPIKVLASRNDHIVPPKMTVDIWESYGISWLDTGGHMLPITESQWCVAQIKEFLKDAK